MGKKGKKVAFLTLGCKVNSYESIAMEKLFKEAGYVVTDFQDKADIYIINTCTVTNMADRKSRQMIHRARKMNPEGVVAAVGCYVEAAREKVELDTAVDIVVGNQEKSCIVERIEAFLESGKSVLKESQNVFSIHEYEELQIDTAGEKTRAYIKIQDGCNQFCSYCIIPYARGRVRSRKIDDIVNEVRRMVKNGYQEIVLTGIHLSSYGIDLELFSGEKGIKDFVLLEGKPLLFVIEEISKIEGLKRIRLGSLEPRIITNEFVEKISRNELVCPHFHLSLQSGCNTTLQRMNRKYTVEEYFGKCDLLRDYYDKPAITTDIIVGFPGETEEEFQMTADFLRKVRFSKMHIFKFSVRKGTKAEKLSDRVPEEIKNKRSDVLLELERQLGESYRKAWLKTKQNILIEEEIILEGNTYQVGHNERYLKLAIQSSEISRYPSNSIISVQAVKMMKEQMLLCE